MPLIILIAVVLLAQYSGAIMGFLGFLAMIAVMAWCLKMQYGIFANFWPLASLVVLYIVFKLFAY